MLEHKAFVLKYQDFEHELRPILEDALLSGETRRLLSFVTAHLSELRDPYEGEPLDTVWESLMESKDVHQYGDFALTKYYHPAVDIGLGREWEIVQEMLASDRLLMLSPILGSTVGPRDAPFDPGKLGSYFQSAEQVQKSLEYLLQRVQRGGSRCANMAIEMLRIAATSNSGLYVTF